MRLLLVLSSLGLVLAAPAEAQPADDGWRQASLIPITELAHPRRRGQVPHGTPQSAPTPEPTPEVAVAPTPKPLPTQDPDAIPADASQEIVRPRIALGAFWPVPVAGLPTTRPAPNLDLTLWQGGWGVGGGLMMFGKTYLAGRTAPYLGENTPLTELLLKQRSVEDPYDRAHPEAPVKPHTELWVGYRGLGLGDVNFAAAGGAFTLPVGLRDITFKGSGVGAIAPSGAFCIDGRLGFGLRAGALEAEISVRDIYLVVAGQPALNMWGPQASIGATF
ncbi:MAG: hypothetical protein JWM80_5993 [Cyanobacteria bacterium RYN_339]|nr:hypothetical protein [Cyanobacteria bacterium RYN_339]